jgi:diadenosine tetraphosphatase ApaH/serine/threonine PP2A family protein phosphatase
VGEDGEERGVGDRHSARRPLLMETSPQELLRMVARVLADLGATRDAGGLWRFGELTVELRVQGGRAMVVFGGGAPPCVRFVEVRDEHQAAMIAKFARFLVDDQGVVVCGLMHRGASFH